MLLRCAKTTQHSSAEVGRTNPLTAAISWEGRSLAQAISLSNPLELRLQDGALLKGCAQLQAFPPFSTAAWCAIDTASTYKAQERTCQQNEPGQLVLSKAQHSVVTLERQNSSEMGCGKFFHLLHSSPLLLPAVHLRSTSFRSDSPASGCTF